MATVFTRIIDGELPARLVWQDERCVAFLNITPLAPGHTLVVPREEVDHWVDLDPGLAAHLSYVAQAIGKAMQAGFEPEKVGLLIAGLEIPHTHLHVWPIHGPLVVPVDYGDEEDPDPDWDQLDEVAETLQRALANLGFEEYLP